MRFRISSAIFYVTKERGLTGTAFGPIDFHSYRSGSGFLWGKRDLEERHRRARCRIK